MYNNVNSEHVLNTQCTMTVMYRNAEYASVQVTVDIAKAVQ